eukprot:TRINITY_DN410_c0_g1_i2.p1 TRINITY_DN410_c0_g1~~TRINITY_DN410_c0_g1_i2.p1  ORF type:complete len:484 (-),score=140.39 TRINITY_DN410_c0_g1_i2:44-1495(-)
MLNPLLQLNPDNSWWFIIIIIIMFVLIVISCIYVLVYFQHEEDKNEAYFPKVVVVTGLTLAICNVLLLPLDIANTAEQVGMSMGTLWQVVYMFIAFWVIVLIPFAIFFYESEEEESGKNQLSSAIKWELACLFISALVIGLMYAFLGYADVPVTVLKSSFEPSSGNIGCANCKRIYSVLSIRVTLPVYIISMMAFLGWFLFAVFGGIGLAALPMDMIRDFVGRPKSVELAEYSDMRNQLLKRTRKLIEIGNNFKEEEREKGKSSRQKKKFYNKFKQAVYLLEQDHEHLKIAYKMRGGSPIPYYAKLIFGIIGLSISIMWTVHIIGYLIIGQYFPPAEPLLNTMFVELDTAWPLLGTLAYGFYAFYLLLCVIKGNFKFGMRFFCFAIHPMKINGTMMNSFLFNTGMVLLCSISVTQFCTTAFDIYARFTAADLIFTSQVKYLRFLRYFWQFYVFAIVGFLLLSTIFLCIKPKDEPNLLVEDDDD